MLRPLETPQQGGDVVSLFLASGHETIREVAADAIAQAETRGVPVFASYRDLLVQVLPGDDLEAFVERYTAAIRKRLEEWRIRWVHPKRGSIA